MVLPHLQQALPQLQQAVSQLQQGEGNGGEEASTTLRGARRTAAPRRKAPSGRTPQADAKSYEEDLLGLSDNGREDGDGGENDENVKADDEDDEDGNGRPPMKIKKQKPKLKRTTVKPQRVITVLPHPLDGYCRVSFCPLLFTWPMLTLSRPSCVSSCQSSALFTLSRMV
jgi:hypothetical protein